MAHLAIKGHATRGKEVINLLEMLGANRLGYKDTFVGFYYYIGCGAICSSDEYPTYATIFTLEEFEEKFPYKVGDKVCFSDAPNHYLTIKKIWWNSDCSDLECTFHEDDIDVPVKDLQPYKEETLEVTEEFYNKHCVNCGSQRCTHNGEWLKECEHYKEETTNKAIFEGNAQSCDIMNNIIKENMKEIKIDIPKGYEFFGIDDDNKIVLAEKQPQYPKTYEECCEVLNLGEDGKLWTKGYKSSLVQSIHQLIICRDAYWKIAGEQMGLGKPWEPDWTNLTQKYCIWCCKGKVDTLEAIYTNKILVFPTEEIRNAFFNNFKELIESCKELL